MTSRHPQARISYPTVTTRFVCRRVDERYTGAVTVFDELDALLTVARVLLDLGCAKLSKSRGKRRRAWGQRRRHLPSWSARPTLTPSGRSPTTPKAGPEVANLVLIEAVRLREGFRPHRQRRHRQRRHRPGRGPGYLDGVLVKGNAHAN